MKRSNRSAHIPGQSLVMGRRGHGSPDAGEADPSTVDTQHPSRQAELVRLVRLDGNLPLLLRSPQDVATAAVIPAWVTQRLLIDGRGALPPRTVLDQHP